MALGQSLQQRQQLKFSPQQVQLMKLLQVPTANLEERIKEELEENPALELSDDDLEDDLSLEIKDEYEAFKYIKELTYDETFEGTGETPRFEPAPPTLPEKTGPETGTTGR